MQSGSILMGHWLMRLVDNEEWVSSSPYRESHQYK